MGNGLQTDHCKAEHSASKQGNCRTVKAAAVAGDFALNPFKFAQYGLNHTELYL